jgi:hypothetical protein
MFLTDNSFEHTVYVIDTGGKFAAGIVDTGGAP